VISNVAKIDAIVIHTDEVAMCLPGHTLEEGINVAFGPWMNVPSPKAKCCIGVSERGIRFLVQNEAFGFECIWVWIHDLEQVK
jgi:hypothetical protein